MNHGLFAKLEKIVEAIDADRTAKLAAIVEKYETALNESAGTFKESVVGNISDYLDLYLVRTAPKQMHWAFSDLVLVLECFRVVG